MKCKIKRGRTCLLALLVILLLAMPVSAGKKGTISSNTGLFVREKNSLKSERIGSLPDKAQVIIVSETGNWYKIEYVTNQGHEYGYVLKKFVQAEGKSEKKKDKKKSKDKKDKTDKKAKTKNKKKNKNKNDKENKKDKIDQKDNTDQKDQKGKSEKKDDIDKKESKNKSNKKEDKNKQEEKTKNNDKNKKSGKKKKNNKASSKNYQSIIVGADLLNVRQKNSKKSAIIATVRALETYPIIKLTKNWVKIALTSDTHGFVMRKYVDFSVVESFEGHEVDTDSTDNTASDNVSGDDQSDANIIDSSSQDDETANLGTQGSTTKPQIHASDIDFTAVQNMVAVSTVNAVNVRRDTNLESTVLAMLLEGGRLEATGDSEHWIRVNIDDDIGYIMKPYATLEPGVLVAEMPIPDIHIAKNESEIIDPKGNTGTDVVEFAKQFLGNPYVWGGTSLTNGADCSGFVQSVYRRFGYNLSRTSAQQRHEGIAVSSLSEAMPGDLICYDGHIGIFAGHDVGLIHASNRRSGIIISGNPSYRPILAIRRIIY